MAYLFICQSYPISNPQRNCFILIGQAKIDTSLFRKVQRHGRDCMIKILLIFDCMSMHSSYLWHKLRYLTTWPNESWSCTTTKMAYLDFYKQLNDCLDCCIAQNQYQAKDEVTCCYCLPRNSDVSSQKYLIRQH